MLFLQVSKLSGNIFLFLQAAGAEAAAEVPNVEILKHLVFLIP